ncbi:MAG: hypothetical protein MJ147_08135 [Clostridia bacterium]|nr:hypothetical protein [Clostridia bacterium]
MRLKKVLSVILALSMVLTMAPLATFGFTANAASIGDEDVDRNMLHNDELIRPNATVEVSPVTRVAYSTSELNRQVASGNSGVIVAATPSGIAKNTYTFADALYAGETPVSTTIKFAPGADVDASSISISCSNSSVVLEGPTSPSAGVYVWTVKDGATAAVGEVLKFSVSYKYAYTDETTGKTYNSGKVFTTTGYSYVESILSPAGIFSHRRVYISYVVASKNVNRSYVASYLLGSGVYATSNVHDAFNPNTGAGLEGTTFGNMLYNSTSGTGKIVNSGFKADNNRPTSVVYFDTDRGTTLAAQNLRFASFMPQQTLDDDDQKTSLKLDEIRDVTGNVQTFKDGEAEGWSISGNTTDLGVTKTAAAENGVSTVGPFFTIPFGGTGPSADSGIYTVALNFQTPGYWGGVYTRHSHTLTIYKVNKGALRQKLLAVVNNEPAGPHITDSYSGKGYNPQEWYYSEGWSDYATAYAEAQKTVNKPNATAGEIATATNTLDSAYSRLVLAPADYETIDFYYNYANSLDSSIYDPSTWATLEKALAKYDTGYSALYQPKLDVICDEIQKALDGLRVADADYTKVDEKVDVINGIMQDLLYDYDLTPDEFYTNWNVVTTALDNCGYYYDTDSEAYVLDPARTKKKTEQPTVDGYPLTLQTAIDKLTKRDADYTETRAAFLAYSSFKSSTAPYITAESLAPIEEAYENLYALYSPALKIDRQRDIDEAVDALNEALKNYEYRPADYTAANAAKQSYNAIDRSIYTDLSAVDSAYQALLGVYGLDAREQTKVDNAVNKLNAAIESLQKKPADYTKVNNAITAANAEGTKITNKYGYGPETFYKNWDAVTTAINSVVRGLDITHQSQVDGYATAINNAVANLTEREADYTALNKTVAEANKYFEDSVSALYTEESISALFDAVSAVDYGKKISQQADVNAFDKAINDAIAGLEFKKADYSSVTKAISNADRAKNKSEAFAAAHNGVPYYTADSIAKLNEKIDAVVYELPISEQRTVDNYASAINAAVTALVIGPADYTAVEAAKAAIPADLSIYTDVSKVTLTSALSYNPNLKADKQSQVDAYAVAIYEGIEALRMKDIDVSAYMAAKKTIPANLTAYTDDTVAAVNNQVAAIDSFLATNPDASKQGELDTMVADLVGKIAALELKPVAADYSAVESAKAAANAKLNSSDAANYTDETKKAVADAIDAVIYDLTEDKQAQVDAMAKAINDAVAALTYKPLDTSALDEAKDKFDELDKDLYDEDVIKAIEDKIAEAEEIANKDDASIKDQEALDKLVDEINDALTDPEKKLADYSAVDKALEDAYALAVNKDLYKDFSAVEAAIAAVVRDLTIDKQADVDEMAKAINDAIAALEFKDIDTAAYLAAKGTIPADLSVYTAETVKAVEDQVKAIEEFLSAGVDIRDQADLDEMVEVLKVKIDELAKIPADYSELKKALADFESLNEDDYSNFSEKKAVYTSAKEWMEEGPVDIDKQSEVDEWTKAVRDAIAGLEEAVPPAYFGVKADSTAIINDGTNFITGLKTALTLKELKEQFLDYDGVQVTFTKASRTAKYYGTGSTIKVTYPDGKVETYTIVIYGDLDGNGIIDVTDTSTAQLAAVGSPLTAAQRFAGNVDGVARVTESDAVVISAAAAGKVINQVDPTL